MEGLDENVKIHMAFKQVTIIGTGLIGGSLGLALKKRRLAGRIIGCDRAPVLERAQECGAIEAGTTNPARCCARQRSGRAGNARDPDPRSGRAARPSSAGQDTRHRRRQHQSGDCRARRKIVRPKCRTAIPRRASHGRQRKRRSRIRQMPILFEGAAWLFTPLPGQNVHAGLCGEFVHCAEKMGARVAVCSIRPTTTASAPGSATSRR